MTTKKVKTEAELREYLTRKYWDCILIDGYIEVSEPIYIDRDVTVMGGTIKYIGSDPDLLQSAAFVVREATYVSFNSMVVLAAPVGLQSGIIINNPEAVVTIYDCLFAMFAYAGIWQFASTKVMVTNTTIYGTHLADKGYNYGIWQGGKSDIPEQRLYVTDCVFRGSRHAIGASYHPNSYYVTGCKVSTLKHSFDRHNWNGGGNKGGLHTVISGNTFTDPDRLAFSLEKPYEGGSIVFSGNKLNHSKDRHIGEIADEKVWQSVNHGWFGGNQFNM